VVSHRPLSASILLALSWLALASAGCVDDESVFTQGRIEKPCNAAIPVCDVQAACTLKNDEYYEGQFPGGQRVIVTTETDDAKLIARFLLREMLYPGTEMLVQAHTPDCGRFTEEHPQDVDLFDLAGDDRVLEYQLELPGRGDHLVEIFSDMSADYTMTLTIEEEGA
jgi:hypothetical protein